MMRPPIVLWPRNVSFIESPNQLEVRFTSDFPWLRREVDLAGMFAQAIADATVSASSFDGVHSLEIQTFQDLWILKRRVNRIISALAIFPAGVNGPTLAFALGWNFIPGTREHTTVGDLERRAKWYSDPEATRLLGERMVRLALAHDALKASATIVHIASSRPLAQQLAATVASGLGASLVVAEKTEATRKQHEADDPLDFESIVARANQALHLPEATIREPVLVIDDLYRTGGTLLEVTRCLRERGIDRVYCLTAAKTVKFHQQT